MSDELIMLNDEGGNKHNSSFSTHHSSFNVPEIRFKGFSGEWDTCRLDEAATVERGKFSVRPRNDPRYFGGNIPFVQTGDIVSSSRRLRRFSQTLNEKGLAVSRLFPNNSILITIAANIGDLAITDFSVACPDSVVAINANDDFDTGFLFDFLGTKKSDLEAVATTNAQANINLQILNPLKVVVPTLKEQTQIGNYFQQLDTLIAQHQQKHDKLLNLKKALLELMFPKQGATLPEIRFKGFSGEWEEKALGEIADVRDGTHDSPQYHPEGYPFVTSKNVKNGYINYDDVQYISKNDFDEINKRSKVDINDILMGMIGTIGNIALIRETADFAIKNVALIKDKKLANYLYVYYFLQSPITLKQLEDGVDGGTQKFISLSNVRHLLISLPDKIEQSKIGNLFQQLDTLITQHQSQLKKLNNIKQACLEKMFV